MQGHTVVHVQHQTSEESCNDSRMGFKTVMVSLLLMVIVFSIVWFGVFNPFIS